MANVSHNYSSDLKLQEIKQECFGWPSTQHFTKLLDCHKNAKEKRALPSYFFCHSLAFTRSPMAYLVICALVRQVRNNFLLCIFWYVQCMIIFFVSTSHVQGMAEIKTDIGHARAWIRWAWRMAWMLASVISSFPSKTRNLEPSFCPFHVYDTSVLFFTSKTYFREEGYL